MTKADELIAAYEEALEKERQAEALRINQILVSGQARFTDNLLTWFGNDLLDEFGRAQIEPKWDKQLKGATYTLPVTWQGLSGRIDGGARGSNMGNHIRPRIEFIVDGKNGNHELYMDLPAMVSKEPTAEYTVVATELDVIRLGAFLAEVLADVAAGKARKEQAAQRSREWAIRTWEGKIMDAPDLGSLCLHTLAAMTEFIDQAGHFQDLYDAAKVRLVEAQAETERNLAHERELRAEEERMQAEEIAKFKPFTLYQVEYFRVYDDDGSTDVEVCYCCRRAVGADGEWLELNRGQIRRVWLPNVFRVVELRINESSDLPWGVYGQDWRKSEKFPEVGIPVTILPELG
jgi:hypothetical protein